MSWYKPWTWADESDSQQGQRKELRGEGLASSNFAGQGESGYGALGAEADTARQGLRDQASGKLSLSSEQLRQGLQQQQAQMQSMAAGGPASSQPMNARTAMLGAGRASSAMAGNAAMAGIQERSAAQKALMDAILGQRQQDMQVALGSRQNAIAGYGGATPGQSWMDKWGGAIMGGAGLLAGGGGGGK